MLARAGLLEGDTVMPKKADESDVLRSGKRGMTRAATVDRSGHVREKDRPFAKGKELAYIDKHDQVRRPDDRLLGLKGEVLGQTRDGKAFSKLDFLGQENEWGYVDAEGNVRLRDTRWQKGRVIGQVRGSNPAGALAFFMQAFEKLQTRFEQLQSDVDAADDKGRFLRPVTNMIEGLPTAQALGDFEGLSNRLARLKTTIEDSIGKVQRARAEKKERIVHDAENLARTAENWKEGDERFRSLREEFKKVGSAGPDDERLWARLQGASEDFRDRKQKFFDQRDREREANERKKIAICKRAEDARFSTSWGETTRLMGDLMTEWKAAGRCERTKDDELWARFSDARQKFFDRKKEHQANRQAEEQRNLSEKESLCRTVEALRYSSDLRAATEAAKKAQLEWKSIGLVPHEAKERLRDRFREACDEVFEAAGRERDENTRKRIEKNREYADQIREKITNKRDFIDRQQARIYGLRPGGRADEIRADIEQRIDNAREQLEALETKLSSVEDQISNMENRLHR